MKQDLTIEVTTSMSISDETAKRCMILMEMWLDDNPDKTIVCNMKGGKHKMYIMNKGGLKCGTNKQSNP